MVKSPQTLVLIAEAPLRGCRPLICIFEHLPSSGLCAGGSGFRTASGGLANQRPIWFRVVAPKVDTICLIMGMWTRWGDAACVLALGARLADEHGAQAARPG
ncbi:unnamed protein product [Nezara viridula]|uniref:Uncharacterized protein n=1 Tax=Nezara viridula TaxID=85310 RepID=A0A9P0GYG6_NEZVI|nr:unnamed protein product [Nezara viridula]